MRDERLRIQRFKTSGQWESGLSYRLRSLEEGGITLYDMPTLTEWVHREEPFRNPGALAADECGALYLLHAETCRLYRFDPQVRIAETMHFIAGCGSLPGTVTGRVKIVMDPLTFWVLDGGDGSSNGRVQAFSREHFQIRYLIGELQKPVGMALDADGRLYVLDGGAGQIAVYENNGRNTGVAFGKERFIEPLDLALGGDGTLYVLDGGYRGLLRFDTAGEFIGIAGNFDGISEALQPSQLVIDRDGTIFTADGGSGGIHQFDPDGSHVGVINIPDAASVRSIAVDSAGNLYAGTDRGIAMMSRRNSYTNEPGIYYSRGLDSGIEGCQWHRAALQAVLPPRSLFRLYCYTSDDPELKKRIDGIISDPGSSAQQKHELLEETIPWSAPEENPEDMLFRGNRGRYLWLKLVLSTFDGTVAPRIGQIRLFYPRLSYLRYLPAIYQEDPDSKEFLERFLSLFESVCYDLETDIGNLFKYFDPETVPREFLAWLASWLNLALEEEWPEATQRRFVEQAYLLYRLKGTPEGIAGMIAIYTGKKPLILEYAKMAKPMVLSRDGQFRLGIGSLLLRTPVRAFRLGDDSILGRSAIREEPSAEEPFLPLAHRFAVMLDLSAEEVKKQEKGIRRILEEGKPAHTLYTLRFTEGTAGIGRWSYVGVSTRVDDYKPVQIGGAAVLGRNLIAYDNREAVGKAEWRSRLGSDTVLD